MEPLSRSEAMRFIPSPRAIERANGSHEVRYVPPHLLSRCGLPRNGASRRDGVGRVRKANFLSTLLDDKELAWALICTLIASRASAAT
jgi:hypothetical protein